MRQTLTVILCALMIGCASKPVEVAKVNERLFHPELPVPVAPYSFKWKVKVIDENTVIVGLEYDESIEFRVFLEDIKRYIKESNSVICSYRRDLEEPICKKAP